MSQPKLPEPATFSRENSRTKTLEELLFTVLQCRDVFLAGQNPCRDSKLRGEPLFRILYRQSHSRPSRSIIGRRNFSTLPGK